MRILVNIKIIYYIIIMPIVMLALNSINITNLFKKNKIAEARILYVILTLSLTYLTVNFVFDVLSITNLY